MDTVKKYLKRCANSQRTKDIISWDEIKNYINLNLPQFLDKENWEATSFKDFNSGIAMQGYFGYTVVNGQAHYFVQEFFQFRNKEHTGESLTLSAIVEIDAQGEKISQVEFKTFNDTAFGAKNTRSNCNGYEVILTDAKSLDDLVKGKFKNIN